MIHYLTLDDVLAAAEAHLGHPADVGDYGLLESAVARPQATVFGEDAYPDLHQKAAALLQSLATNHALIDGNKRTAFVATALFYMMNGHRIPAEPEDELFDFVIAVATRDLTAVPEIAGGLTRWVRPAAGRSQARHDRESAKADPSHRPSAGQHPPAAEHQAQPDKGAQSRPDAGQPPPEPQR